MIWLPYTILEYFIWDYRIRETLNVGPLLQLTCSALNDVIWIPIGIALSVYIILLLSRLLQRFVIRDIVVFVFAGFILISLTNIHFYFRIIWLLTLLFFALWFTEIRRLRQIRLSFLFFSVALIGLFIKYNSQLFPRLPQSHKSTLTVMSFNFNTQMAMDDERTIQFIRDHIPDIVFLQEFTGKERRYIRSQLDALYPYALLPCSRCGKNDVMILSRKKILYGDQVRLRTPYSANYDSANHAVIEFQGEKVHLLNCHLSHPVRFVSKYLQSDSSAFYLKALQKAYNHHREEARLLAEYMRGLEGPIILAGDFNDTPNSFVYHLFAERRQNAFAVAGYGLGATFGEWTLRSHLPAIFHALAIDYLRIDHIFCSFDFKVKSATVTPLAAFDHRPQLATLELQR